MEFLESNNFFYEEFQERVFHFRSGKKRWTSQMLLVILNTIKVSAFNVKITMCIFDVKMLCMYCEY
jgi:hypothetical protein